MAIYKSQAGKWTSVRTLAEEDGPEFETFELPKGKNEILAMLNEHCAASRTEKVAPPKPPPIRDNRSWADKQSDAKDEAELVEDHILSADYEESRRLQSLATERMVEHLAKRRYEMRMKEENS